jgi:hypothetical protein
LQDKYLQGLVLFIYISILPKSQFEPRILSLSKTNVH